MVMRIEGSEAYARIDWSRFYVVPSIRLQYRKTYITKQPQV